MKRINKRGVVLITIYFVIASLIVLVAAATHRAISELNLAKRNMANTEALYLAEAGVEKAAYELGSYVANNFVDPADGLISGFINLSSDFNGSYTCSSMGDDTTYTDPNGITTIVRKFIISATVSHNSYDVTVNVNQLVARKKTYTFQHAVFYTDDLEILPGPNMTLSGRVHSNSDIYMGTHNALTIDTEYLRSAGNIYNKRKDSADVMAGSVRIKIKDLGGYALMKQPADLQPLDCDRSDWMNESQNRWNGTVKSGVHGVTTLAVPQVGSVAPSGYYATNANVKIVNGVITQNGVPLVEGVDIPSGTISTNTTFYNNREGKWVKMTSIDMKKMAGYKEGDVVPSFPNHLPTNGLIYATRNDAAGAQEPGIRLVNGSKIERNDGLTVVSNLPVYIQGNYNTDTKKPAAVICDAVNILSNNWSDSRSTQNLNNRVANNTQVDLAFIAGIDTTTSGVYNGGLENYPRFHENWTNKTLYIRGSFVELWNSQIAQGQWLYGNPQYTAPTRDWNYDSDFNNANKLPPFTPFAVEIERVAWWK